MKQRGPESTCERVPRAAVAVAWVVATAAAVRFAVEAGEGLAVTAALLLVGDVREKGGLAALVGWLLGGSLLGAALGYGATAVIAGVPLATNVAVGLGIALGGGVGVVSNLLAEDAGSPDGTAETGESMTVDMETDDSSSPRPADLFDGHPDPVLYVADQGHGPVVLAANDAFVRTFDVPGEAMSGTPLGEVLLTTSEESAPADTGAIVDAVEADDEIDDVLTCQTPDGTTEFRIRTAGRGTDGYVIYTPTHAVE